MTELTGTLALMCTGAGLVAAAVAWVRTREPAPALRLGFDFWLAAGLLRLSGSPSWPEIAAAASLIALRRLLAFDLLGTPARPYLPGSLPADDTHR